MPFDNFKYESDSGNIFTCRLDPTRGAQAGTPPTGSTTSALFAQLSKSNREFGIRPRYVTLRRQLGSPPDTFFKYSRLPVLTPTDWQSATFAVGAEITIGGITWTIIGRVNEDF